MTGPKHMDWDKRQVILGQFLLFIYVGDLNIQKLKKKKKVAVGDLNIQKLKKKKKVASDTPVCQKLK